jgi:hypothetical protein
MTTEKSGFLMDTGESVFPVHLRGSLSSGQLAAGSFSEQLFFSASYLIPVSPFLPKAVSVGFLEDFPMSMRSAKGAFLKRGPTWV